MFGFNLVEVLGAVLVGNTASRNGDVVNHPDESSGINLAESSGISMTGNLAIENETNGINLYLTSDTQIVGNVARGNGNSGFSLDGSSGNLLQSNRSTANLQDGFDVFNVSSYNSIIRNFACGNLSVDAWDDHSGTGNLWRANKFCTSEI
jgi:parallel beta-helix repeat protein